MGTVELMNFSLGSMQKSTLSGTGVTQEYCTVVCSEINEWIGFLKCSCSKSLRRVASMLYFFQILQFEIEEKSSFPFLQYFCQLFCSNYLCVDINYHKVPWNLTLLCNRTLFVQWLPTISSFENECLANTYLILPFLSELQEGCAWWAKGGFLCFPSSEIPCHWASLFHTGVLMLTTKLAKGLFWCEGFAPGEPWLLYLRALTASNISQFWKAFLLLPIKYKNYEVTMENRYLVHCIRY